MATKEITRTCEQCGVTFTRPARRRQRFCSKRCGSQSHARGRRGSLIERMAAKTRRAGADECWPWIGGVDHFGYGRIYDHGTSYQVHRVVYELEHGPIPDGLLVLHRCDNPPCVNPAHLFLGTNQDNVNDMLQKGRERRGETHHNAKISTQQVLELRQQFAAGRSAASLARAFGVDPSNVRLIVLGKTRKHG